MRSPRHRVTQLARLMTKSPFLPGRLGSARNADRPRQRRNASIAMGSRIQPQALSRSPTASARRSPVHKTVMLNSPCMLKILYQFAFIHTTFLNYQASGPILLIQ
jgi:hypothetical protein